MNEQTELPPGYSLEHDICNTLIFIQKDGAFIRRANRQPIQFGISDKAQAIKYAWWHHDTNKKPLAD